MPGFIYLDRKNLIKGKDCNLLNINGNNGLFDVPTAGH
jgi:hypothetical protein